MKTIKDLQNSVLEVWLNYCKQNWLKSEKDFLLIKLIEEIGELSQAILIHEKKCRIWKRLDKKDSELELKREFGDVFWMLMILADKHNIDIQESIENKRINNISTQRKAC